MYYYSFSYLTHEDSFNINLKHNKKFTKTQIDDIFTEAALYFIREVEKKGGRVKELCYDDLFYSELFSNYLKGVGFEELKIEQNVDVFGWATIIDDKNRKICRDEIEHKISNKLKKLGYK